MATRLLIMVSLLTIATAQQYVLIENVYYNQLRPYDQININDAVTVKQYGTTPRYSDYFPSKQNTNRQGPPSDPLNINNFPTVKQYGTTPRYEDYFPSTPNTVAPAPHKETLNEKFLAGNVNFTAAVYHQQVLRQRSENFIMCPISTQLVLALTQCGARGNTASELANTLRVPSNQNELLQTISEVIPYLQGNREYAVHVANKIYAKSGFQLSEDFKNVSVNYFNSEVEAIDFLNPQAANMMNQWAYQKTNGKINHLIDASVLNNRTSLVLLNAIYFKGKWVYDFDDHFTKDRDFHLNKDDSVKVKTMQMTTRLNYYESEELKARFVELPYEGVNITMTIVLPNEIEGLEEVERNLEKVLKHQTYTLEDVHVRLPKFNVTSTVDFAEILKNLGVTEAFDDKKADFTGISKFPQRLKIDQVVQKAVLEIDEKGTQATAATYTIAAIPISAIFVPPPLPKLYEVNHPFLYYIKSPAGILFVGRYVK